MGECVWCGVTHFRTASCLCMSAVSHHLEKNEISDQMNFLRGSSGNLATMLFKMCCVWSVKYLSKVLIQPDKDKTSDLKPISTPKFGKHTAEYKETGPPDPQHTSATLYPHPFIWWADTKRGGQGRQRESALCSNRSKIKLIFYSSRSVPLRSYLAEWFQKKWLKSTFYASLARNNVEYLSL